MVTSKQKLTEQLPDILDELQEVQLFFTVWRAFTNVANQSIFQPTMEQYPQFFDSIVRASFSAVIVGLYRIYDGDHRTKSLRQLYMHTKSLNILEQKLIERTSHLDSEIQSTWKKVCILRSNIFGHRNAKLSPEKAFDKAKVTPDELAAITTVRLNPEQIQLIARVALAGVVAAA